VSEHRERTRGRKRYLRTVIERLSRSRSPRTRGRITASRAVERRRSPRSERRQVAGRHREAPVVGLGDPFTIPSPEPGAVLGSRKADIEDLVAVGFGNPRPCRPRRTRPHSRRRKRSGRQSTLPRGPVIERVPKQVLEQLLEPVGVGPDPELSLDRGAASPVSTIDQALVAQSCTDTGSSSAVVAPCSANESRSSISCAIRSRGLPTGLELGSIARFGEFERTPCDVQGFRRSWLTTLVNSCRRSFCRSSVSRDRSRSVS